MALKRKTTTTNVYPHLHNSYVFLNGFIDAIGLNSSIKLVCVAIFSVRDGLSCRLQIFRLLQDEESPVSSRSSTPANSVCISNDELLESLLTPEGKSNKDISAPGKSSNTFIRGLPSPYSKVFPAKDDEHGIIEDYFHEKIQGPVRRQLGRYYSFNRSSPASKRHCEDNDDDILSNIKHFRDEKFTTQNINHFSQIHLAENRPRTAIGNTVDKLCGNTEFIADGSKPYCLPTVRGRHSDLKSLTPNTVADVLKGSYSDHVESCTIIDCRYPYEYDAGHIKGAINIYRGEEVRNLLLQPTMSCFSSKSSKRNILIFHCEFSSERGPKLCRFLRKLDREMHKEDYPRLTYPEVYLLEGGYKSFYESHKDLCEPCGYKPMLHQAHTSDLRHFRVKCKSWTSGEKRRPNRLALRF
ncbi:hypothetical protein ACJMK2_006674 [Sinanodonta woodiana]|uniref:M-phase inducer phosphatase n=1 Tax=Sinanodonta woodiana TaxID=1069815 RepID=A0ABD3VTW4_SINWO